MGQSWAAAQEPFWRKDPQRGFIQRVVVCHTDRMDPATRERPYNDCRLYDVEVSFETCSNCPDRDGMTYRFSPGLPDQGD